MMKRLCSMTLVTLEVNIKHTPSVSNRTLFLKLSYSSLITAHMPVTRYFEYKVIILTFQKSQGEEKLNCFKPVGTFQAKISNPHAGFPSLWLNLGLNSLFRSPWICSYELWIEKLKRFRHHFPYCSFEYILSSNDGLIHISNRFTRQVRTKPKFKLFPTKSKGTSRRGWIICSNRKVQKLVHKKRTM